MNKREAANLNLLQFCITKQIEKYAKAARSEIIFFGYAIPDEDDVSFDVFTNSALLRQDKGVEMLVERFRAEVLYFVAPTIPPKKKVNR